MSRTEKDEASRGNARNVSMVKGIGWLFHLLNSTIHVELKGKFEFWKTFFSQLSFFLTIEGEALSSEGSQRTVRDVFCALANRRRMRHRRLPSADLFDDQ
jgi:hypothetical protein